MQRLLLLLFIALPVWGISQVNTGYQKPPKDILDLVDVPLAPGVMMDNEREYMVFRYRDAYKTIAELSEKELRLGGLRINPKTNIGSRTSYYNNLKVRKFNDTKADAKQVSGLPSAPRMANFAWSPDQKKIAFTHTTLDGVELWVLDIASAKATKLTEANVNANMGNVINWFEDSQNMLVMMLPKDRKPLIEASAAIPTGPTISENAGKKAQNRTYQDLLKNKTDEFNFEQLAHSELYKVNVDGSSKQFLGSDMYSGINFSPDGSYLLITTVEKPFSYLVPYYRFPSKTTVYAADGTPVKTLLEVPLIEDLPKGFMAVRTGMRGLGWRADRPATLIYTKALDGGDPANEVEYRDEVFEWDMPLDAPARSLMKTINRFAGVDWGNDNVAVGYDYWWDSRNTKAYLFNPSDAGQKPKIIEDRNYQDRYSDPGSIVSKRNSYGSYVMAMDGNSVYLLGDGFTPEGQFPFLDKVDLKTGKKERVYQSEYTDKRESLNSLKTDKMEMLVRLESNTEYPNYYIRNLKNGQLRQVTNFENPFKSLGEVEKEVITYKREDGLELSGTLYLPPGYDKEKKPKLPMILWAYPREYKDKSSASQNTQNPNTFTYPYWGSPIYWVKRGYIVLDNAAFPIVGEGDEEPNDSFREQLVGNAKAAIDAVDDLGYIDRQRVAVGGHSYGAFMVANLLSHSNLFAAGIARSGAYNRTLTPFGFQSEQRSYWEAPEVYYTMSPFMHADKMKTPLLLVHGEADNNSGTYPLQSERYFNALKGLGATVRLVMLPKESHGYRAKESILHLLWEQDQWLEKHVKAKKP